MVEILYYERRFSTIKLVELIEKKEFAAKPFDPGYEIFIVHIASLNSLSNMQKDNVHLFYIVQIAVLVANETSISILIEYSKYADVLS